MSKILNAREGSKILNAREGSKILSEAKGFTLLEVLIAMFFIIVGATAAFDLVSRITVFSSGSARNLQASYLAQEGAEIVRNIRDSNILKQSKGQAVLWTDGLLGCQAGCRADYTSGALLPSTGTFLQSDGLLHSYAAGTATIFQRKITVTAVDPNLLDVRSEVFWQERGVQKSVNVSSRLSNWFSPSL